MNGAITAYRIVVRVERADRRRLAVHHLVDLREVRQIGEGRIANQVARIVQGAPGHDGDGAALLDQGHDLLEAGRRGLVVDVGLAPLERETPGAAALHAEHRLDLDVEQVHGQQGNDVERGRALTAVLQRLATKVGDVRRRLHAGLGLDVENAAGSGGEHDLPVLVLVPDALVLQQIGKLRRAGGAENCKAVRLGRIVGGPPTHGKLGTDSVRSGPTCAQDVM